MIHTESFRSEIEALLTRYGLDPLILEIVEDVARRATQLGYHDDNPFRQATSISAPSGNRHVIIANEITDDMMDSARAAVVRRGFEAEVGQLSTEPCFLRHLVLHEIAFFVLRTVAQEPRDRWAFHELDSLG